MKKILVKGRQFVDEDGAPVVFRGINMVFKGSRLPDSDKIEYIPDWTEQTFDTLADCNFNLVRFGLIWDAVEPRPGKYCDEYLDKMGEFIGMCNKRGIYVMLDMHQDCYSRDVSDGAPAWACITGSRKYRKPKFIWAESYWFDPAVQTCFDNFWANSPILGKGLQDYYADMWVHVANRLNKYDNILGYDIMNEPYPAKGGKLFRSIAKSAASAVITGKIKKLKTLKKMLSGDPFLGALSALDDPLAFRAFVSGGEELSRDFDENLYYPFLKKVASALRAAGAEGIIFAENNYYSNIGIPCHVPRLVYDDGTAEPNFAFAPHGYDLTVDTPDTNVAGPERVDFIFARHRETQERLNCPVLVGEWGGMVGGADDYPALHHLLALFDKNGWSNTYWAYHKGIEDTKILDILKK